MNRFALFATALLFASTVAAYADPLYVTGFESPRFTTGALAGQNGYTGNLGQVEQAVSYTGNQAVVFRASGTAGQHLDGTGTAFSPIAANDGILVIQVEMLFNAASGTDLAYDVAAPYSSSGFLDQLLIADGKAYVGGKNSDTGGVAVAADTWNTYDLVLNYNTQVSSAFVDGTYIASEPFANAGTNLTSVQFGINDENTATGGVAYFDDLSVSVAPTPEPSSLMLLGTGIVAMASAMRRRLRK